MLFLSYEQAAAAAAPPPEASALASVVPGTASAQPASSAATAPAPTAGSGAGVLPVPALQTIREDPVDEYWRTQEGKIVRGRDEKFCRHGAKGMCDYCMPLEVGLLLCSGVEVAC